MVFFVYNGNDAAGYGVGINGGTLYGLYGGIAWVPTVYSFTASTWSHVVMKRTAGTASFIVNGTSYAATSGGTSTPNVPNNLLTFGNMFDPSNRTYRYFNGLIDEVRISQAARSDDWIKTEYNNQSSPSTFYSVGSEETTYVWNQTSPGSWQTASNWTPARTSPQSGDVLQFNGGGTITVTNVPTQTIGRIMLSSNTTVNLQPDLTSNTLTVNYALTTTAGDVLNLGTGVILSGSLTTITNAGKIQTSVSTSTSSVPIATGKSWSGTIEYKATDGLQTIVAGTYNNLTLGNTSAANTAGGNLTVNGTLLTTAGGSLDMGTSNILGGTLPTISNNGIILTSVPTTTSATPIPSGKIWGGTIEYGAIGGLQTVVAGTYNSLTLGNLSGTNTAGGTIIVNAGIMTTTSGGTLDMGVAAILSGTATFTNGGIIRTSVPTTTSATPIPAGKTWGGTIEYAALAGAQTIVTGTYNNLTIGNTSAANTAGGNLTVNGTLITTAGGTLDMTAAYVLGGSLATIINNGTLSTAVPTATSATPIPSGEDWGGTIIYAGATAQTVVLGSYKNITFSGAGAKTLATGTINISGNWTNNGGTITPGTGTVTFNSAGAQAINGTAASTFNNLTLSGTALVTTGNTVTISSTLSIGDGTTFTVGAFALSVGGTTTIGGGTNGTLTISSATGTKTFIGLVTINSGGSWTNTAANSPVFFRGGITNSGTFNAGTGLNTFDTNSQALSGTFNISSVTITGVTLTNNNTLTVGTALSGSGTLLQAADATLNVGGTSAITGLTATANNNIVNYSGAAQTVHSNNYFNLLLSGSLAKTLQALTTIIAGDLTLSGTASTATVVGLSISGDLNIGNGTSFTAAGVALTVAGTTTVGSGTNGTLTISSATGTKTFSGLVTINPGATWNNSGNSPIIFQGGIFNSGTFTAGSGIHTFNTNSQALSGTFSIPNVTITAVTLTNNNSLTVGTALSGTGGLTQALNATLNLGGTSGISTITATNSGNIVNFNGTGVQTVPAFNYYNLIISGARTVNSVTLANSGTIGIAGTFTASATFAGGNYITTNSTISFNGTAPQSIVGTFAFNNLMINNSSGITLSSANATVNSSLTLSSGNITTGANTLIISNNNTSAVTYTNGYVIGNLQRAIATGASTYRFDVGTSSSYTPLSVAFTGVTVAGNLITKVTPGQNPNSGSPLITSKDVNLYWTLTNSGITCSSYAPTFTYNADDIIGSAIQSNFVVGKYSASSWTAPTPIINGGTDPYTTNVTAQTTYGDFVVGEGFTSNASDYFRSIATGNWNSVSTWQSSADNVSWGPATLVPSNLATLITIQTGHNVTVNAASTGSNLTINSGGTLTGGSSTFSLTGNFINNGTLTAGTGTIILNGTAVQSIGGSTTSVFNNLIYANTTTAYIVSTTCSIAGILTINNSATFTPSAGTITMSAAGSGITNSGSLTLNNLTIAATPTAQSQYNTSYSVAGALTVSATQTFAPTGGTITMAGTAWSIVNNNILTFSGLAIAGTPTTQPTANFSVAGNLNINSGVTLTPTAGTLTMSSASSSISNNGTLLVFKNLTIAATPTAQSQYNTSYSISGTLTVNAAVTFSPAGGTITMTGTGWLITNSGTLLNFYGLTIAGTPTTQPSANFSIAGDLTVNAGQTLAPTAGIITMTGTDWDIVNNNSLTFRGLTIAGTPTVQPTSSFSVAAILTVNLGINFAPTAGTITMSAAGSGITNNGSLSFNNLTISIAPTAQTQYNASYSVGGTHTVNAVTFTPTGGTVTMTGAAGTITSTATTLTFSSLAINGTVTGSGNFGVSTTMAVNGTFTPAAAETISGAGTLTGSGIVKVTRTAATADFSSQYTITNKTLTNLTVEYIGSSAQTISALTYGNLKISNSNILTLGGNATVNSALIFNGGIITTGVNTLTLASGATVSGANAGNYINGKEAWNIPLLSPTKTFDIGDASNYTPVSVNFNNVTTIGTLTVSTSTGDHTNISTSGIDATQSVNRFWTLTNASTLFTSYSPTFNFVSGDVDAGATYSSFVMKNWNGTTWNAPLMGTLNPLNTQATALTTFGDFQIGEAYGTLATDYFRSLTTGNWSSPATWQSSHDNIIWNLATLAPTNTAQNITIQTGHTVTVDISSTASNLVLTGTLSFAGTSALDISGNFSGAGTFIAGSGTVNFNGSTAQTVVGKTYNIFKVNNAAGVTLSSAATISNLTVGDMTSNSVFNDGGFQVTSTGILNLTSGIFNLGSAGTATTFPAFVTRNYGSLPIPTVAFTAGVAQTVAATTYPNLTFSGANTKTTGAGTLNVAGNFSVGSTTTLGTNNTIANITGYINGTGSITQGTGLITVGSDWINTGTFTANATGGVTLNGAAKQITGAAGLTFTTLTVNGTYTNNNPGILTVSTTLGGSGTLTQSTNASLTINGTSGITGLDATTNTPNTITYNGAAQTIKAVSYYHLTLGGSGIKTITSVNTINGNFTLSGTASATATTDITIGGDVTIGLGTVFNGGSFTHNVKGSWANNGGTFTASTSTINFNGISAANINGSATTSFYNLKVNKDAPSTTVTSSSKAFTVGNYLWVTQGNIILTATDAHYTVAGDLTIDINGTLTHSVFWDTYGKQLTVSGNIAIDGLFTYTVRSHLQMNGVNKTVRTGNTPSSAFSIFSLANSSGTISASGLLTANDNFWAAIGIAGGTFSTNGQTVYANKTLYNAGGTLNINGGSLNVTAGLLVGTTSLNGLVNFSSGILNTDGITMGNGTLTGVINQSGGTANIFGNLTINTSCSYICTNSPIINITGNLTNNGTYTKATETVTFNGTAAQAINGTAASQSFYNVVVNKTAGQALTVGGSTTTLTVNNLTETQGNFTPPATLNINGTLTLTAGTLTAGTNINILGDWTNNGGTFTAGANTVTFNGASQTIGGSSSTTFNNLTISSTASTLLAINSNVSGNLNITASRFFDMDTYTCNRITAGGTLTAAGTLLLAGNAGGQTGSNFPTNFTTMTMTGGTVVYDGSSIQTVATGTYNNLTINNNSGVLLGGSSTVNGTLIFTNGIITTGATILSLASGAIVNGAGAGKYINGNLRWYIPNAAAPSKTFYIGDATNYTPVLVSFAGTTSGSGNITAYTVGSEEPNINTSKIDPAQNVNRYWSMVNTGVAGFTSYNATFNFVSSDIDSGADPNTFIVGKYSSGWTYPTYGSRTANSIQATGVTSFSTFVIGVEELPPFVSSQPSNQTACEGNQAVFTSQSTGGIPAPTGTWQVNTGSGFSNLTVTAPYSVSNNTVSGITTSTLTINPTSNPLNSNQYRVIFTNIYGNASSNAATLTVNQTSVGGAVTSVSSNTCLGSSTGTLTLSGNNGIVNKWKKRFNSGSWSDIVNTSITYSEIPATIGNWEYLAEVQNGVCAAVNSSAVSITVDPRPTSVISGTTTLCSGQSTAISVALTGTGPWSLIYTDNTTPVTVNGILSSPYTFAVAPSSTKTYTVTSLSDLKCTSQSGDRTGSAIVTVNTTCQIVTLTQPSQLNAVIGGTTTICVNNPAPITVTFSGGTPPYKVTYNSVDYTGTSPITFNVFPNTSTTYDLSNISVTDANNCISSTTGSAIVSVNQDATKISLTSAPSTASQGLCINTPITNITYSIGGTGTGASIIAGALPAGVSGSYNSGVFTISGIPTVTGIFNYTVGTSGSLCINPSLSGTISVYTIPAAAGNISGTATICQGQAGATYTVPNIANATGYNWSLPVRAAITLGNNTNSITVSYSTTASSGDVKVFGTDGACNGTVSSDFPVTVNPLPIANAGTDRPICSGASTTIGAAAVGGNSYSWSSSPAGFNSSEANPEVSPTITTTYTLLEEVITTGCQKTNSIVVTVNPLPVANTGTTRTICAGTSTEIGATAIGGNTYSWTSVPVGYTSTTANPTVSPVVTTIYTLTETITATTCQKTNSVTVTVNQKSANPTSASALPAIICNGQSSVLTLNGGGSGTGEVIKWYTASCGGTLAGTGNNLSVSPATTTIYYGRYEDGAPCSFNTTCATVTVTVNPLPVITISGNNSVMPGSTDNVYTTESGMSNYVWMVSGGGTITSGGGASDNTVTVTWNTPGSQTVSVNYINVNNCTVTSPTVYNVAVIGFCQYADNSTSGITHTPCINIPSNVQTVSTTFAAHQYFLINVIKGLTYQVYTCNTTNPASSLKMVVYEEGVPAGPLLAASISNTGNPCSANANNVYLSFTSPISGQVRVLINKLTDCSSVTPNALTVNVNVSGGSNTQDNETAAGTNSWIGHIYDGTNVGVAYNGDFANYLGYYTEIESLNQLFGGATDTYCFAVNSNGATRASVLNTTFSVRYRMNSTRHGLFVIDLGHDDGGRLAIDGTLIYDDFVNQGYTPDLRVLMNLTGSSTLVYDFYEGGGGNQVSYQNLILVLANNLSVNNNQLICFR